MTKQRSYLPVQPGDIVMRDGVRYVRDRSGSWFNEETDRQVTPSFLDDKDTEVIRGEPAPRVEVILFKDSGKYYTTEEWHIPQGAVGPYDMIDSPEFRRIGNGKVLIPSQEPWGFPHLL